MSCFRVKLTNISFDFNYVDTILDSCLLFDEIKPQTLFNFYQKKFIENMNNKNISNPK